MIKASEGSEVLLGDGGSKMGADHGIGVGWIADHHNLRPEQCASSSAQTHLYYYILCIYVLDGERYLHCFLGILVK